MILLDTNIVIALGQPPYSSRLTDLLAGESLATCNVVCAEVLGFSNLSNEDETAFSRLLAEMNNLPFDDEVTRIVIAIRRRVKIALPDAIIAATAMVHELELWTRNIRDFSRVPDLLVHDPLV